MKLNFLEALAKFWDLQVRVSVHNLIKWVTIVVGCYVLRAIFNLQGSSLKVPNVERTPLDLHLLFKVGLWLSIESPF